MLMYKYSGKDSKGRNKRGNIEAENRQQAIKFLRDEGIRPREIKETKATLFNKDISISIGGNSVNAEHFVIYARQFATLIRAGVSIVESTEILAKQTESKALGHALTDISEEIKDGKSFSKSIEKYPKIFPDLFVNMIASGEMTGNLDEVLERLADHYEKSHNIQKKVKSTMMYPAVLMVAIIGVVIFMLISIIPTFADMFEQFDSELPAITQLVLTLSDLLIAYWWIILIIVAGSITTFVFFYKRNEKFYFTISYILLKLPIFGKLLQKAAIARMTRTLSSLFASAVPILEALDVVERVVGNPVIGKVVRESHDSLENGQSLSTPIMDSWVFPPIVGQMTLIGEQTETLDYMLEKVADFYEEDVDRTVDSLQSIIEPIMIVLLAVVVGFIVLSIMIPMFTLFTEVQ